MENALLFKKHYQSQIKNGINRKKNLFLQLTMMKKLFLLIVLLTSSSITAQIDSTKSMDIIDSLGAPTASLAVPEQTVLSGGQNSVASVLPPDTIKYDIKKYLAIRFSPDSVKFERLDSLSYEQLQEYYISEPLPPMTGRRPSKGDTIFSILNPLTAPTRTVEGESLFHPFVDVPLSDSALDASEQMMRPKIGIGMGRIAFHGDLANKKFQSALVGRPALDIAISQRLTRYLQLDFAAVVGKFGVNEIGNQHFNMLTEVRAGGVNLIYDFGNFIPDAYKIRPFVSFGVYGFEFLSKTDLKDRDGNLYHYWNDGTIRDRAEGTSDAQFSKEIVRDYTYESDIRTLNRNNFGNYTESAWSFPVGFGAIMKITDRIDLKINYQYYFSSTDNIDGIRGTSGAIKGNKGKDNFTYFSAGLQYDLIAKKIRRAKTEADTIDYNDPYLMAIFNGDKDQDNVPDISDACPDTPPGVGVDEKGCPADEDTDGVPDFRDDEKASPAGFGVNQKGVARTDLYWQSWYDDYMNDSLPGEKVTEFTGNIYAVAKKKGKKDPFTVELMRYNGAIPSDELAFLLSIGDINSTTLEDGTTVVYTSGNYEKLGAAIKRRDEYREEGNKKAGVSMFKGKDVLQLPENELESLLKSEITDLLKLNVNDSVSNLANVVTTSAPDESFTNNTIVYRVQLGAFRNKISTSIFGGSIGVLELKTGENVYRYVTKGYPTIEEAAATRADLVVQGYSDAFVTAYKGGRRIPMSETKATVEKDYKEDMNENKTFNSIDKSLLSFKVQLGPLKKRVQEAGMDARVKDLKDVKKMVTASGTLRYTCGSFPGLELAEEFRKTLEEKGFTDSFVIPTFKEEVISMQEAMELLK